jgi:acyl transferase domain-containing protein
MSESTGQPEPVSVEKRALLGRRMHAELAARLFEVELGAATPEYLGHHRVFGVAIFPAAGYLEQALSASAGLLGEGVVEVSGLTLREALTLPEAGDQPSTRSVQTTLTTRGEDYRFEVHSGHRDPNGMDGEPERRLHAHGWVRRCAGLAGAAELAEAQARCPDTMTSEEFYCRMADVGIAYGPQFQALAQVWQGPGEALGQLLLPDALSADQYHLHPALLDACLQVIGAAAPSPADNGGVYLPILFRKFRWNPAAGDPAWSHAALREGENGSAWAESRTFDLRLYNAEGALAAEIDGLVMKRATLDALRPSTNGREKIVPSSVGTAPAACRNG